MMTGDTPANLRQKAERARRLAIVFSEDQCARGLRDLADDYDRQAALLDERKSFDPK